MKNMQELLRSLYLANPFARSGTRSTVKWNKAGSNSEFIIKTKELSLLS